jgi:hypothetical protein
MKLSRKEISQLSITAALAVVLLVFVGQNLKRGRPQKPTEAVAKLFAEQFAGAAGGQGVSMYRQLAERAKDIKLVRDPFVEPRIPFDPSSKQLVLSGILRDEQMSLAVINGRIVKVGDRLGENTVIHIDPSKVVVHDGVREVQLLIVP